MSIKSKQTHLIGDLKPGTFIKNVGTIPGDGVVISHVPASGFKELVVLIIYRDLGSDHYEYFKVIPQLEVEIIKYAPINLSVQLHRAANILWR